MKSLLLVFAKTPVLGTVKTRLAKTVGNQNALIIYTHLLRKTNQILENLPHEVVIFFNGNNPELLQANFPTFVLKEQNGSDLGERMSHAFQWGFNQGYKNIVIVGTDLWDFDTTLINHAFHLLKTNDCVIGPSKDGGYYLLGKKETIVELFQNKKWSSSSVLAATLEDLKKYKVVLLQEKTDIDTYEDVLHFPELMHLIYPSDERKN